jgi:TP901-1 family phage major tail protein
LVAQKGRDVLVKLNTTGSTYVTVGGARSITVTIANTPVDITNADDAGIRKLLEGAGVNSISLKFQGVYVDDANVGLMRTDAMTNAHRNYEIVMPGSVSEGMLSGKFMITSFEVASTYNETMTNSMTLESAGAVTFA